jgi:hypothetical protein
MGEQILEDVREEMGVEISTYKDTFRKEVLAETKEECIKQIDLKIGENVVTVGKEIYASLKLKFAPKYSK